MIPMQIPPIPNLLTSYLFVSSCTWQTTISSKFGISLYWSGYYLHISSSISSSFLCICLCLYIIKIYPLLALSYPGNNLNLSTMMILYIRSFLWSSTWMELKIDNRLKSSSSTAPSVLNINNYVHFCISCSE